MMTCVDKAEIGGERRLSRVSIQRCDDNGWFHRREILRGLIETLLTLESIGEDSYQGSMEALLKGIKQWSLF
jgi:hypothetical protein